MGSDPQGLTPEDRRTGIVNLGSSYIQAEDDGGPPPVASCARLGDGDAVAGTVPQIGAGVP